MIDFLFDEDDAQNHDTNHLDNILQSLNDIQGQAVKTTEGPVLVLSGAGTGKTRVITSRIAYIIYKNLATPSEILALTFTNKSAKEMVERASTLIDFNLHSMFIGSFHSICAKILRQHANLVGLDRNFDIIDTDDVKRVIKQLFKDNLQWGIKDSADNVKLYMNYISQINLGKTAIRNDDAQVMHQVYRAYQDTLIKINVSDFDNLLIHVVSIFKNHPEVLEHYQDQFKYIMVDEYQDTNLIQYRLIRLLAAKYQNICCVGDDDQSIYSWRGATVDNILNFTKDYPKAAIIKLEENYRSTKSILDVGNTLIKGVDDRLGKTLFTQKEEDSPVVIKENQSCELEARWISEKLIKLQEANIKLSNAAILIRSHSLTRVLEESLINSNLPYVIVGGYRFYERAEIRDMIAYLRLVNNHYDLLSFQRIINKPARSIGAKSVELIINTFNQFDGEKSIIESMQHILDQQQIKGKRGQALQTFIELIQNITDKTTTSNLSQIAEQIFMETGYHDMLDKDKENDRIETVGELITTLNDFTNINEFIEYVTLVFDNSQQASRDDYVSIMTMHTAKGLEFDYVFLPAFENDIFPHIRSIDEGNTDEERRLAYVAVTRARKQLVISYVQYRRQFGTTLHQTPSVFVKDLLQHEKELNLKVFKGTGFGNYNNNKGNYNYNNKPKQSYKFNSSTNYNNDPQTTDYSSPTPSGNGDEMVIGSKVRHNKFGSGTVIGISGQKLTIDFPYYGQKTIISSFVQKV